MFQQFREKLTKQFGAPQDPVDKQVHDLVERCTSEVLIAPDWALNMELVDVINSDPSRKGGSALRALKARLHNAHSKVQLLTLITVETLAKNCSRAFHQQMAASELLGDMRKLVDESPPRKVDGQVRDKILGLIEDLARGLEDYAPYRDAYETLLDHGIDFPVRPDDEQVIFAAASEPLHPVPTAAHGVPAGAAGLDLSGVSDEDRAAIAAAMADLEAEAVRPAPGLQAVHEEPYTELYPPARTASPVQGVIVGHPALPASLSPEQIQVQLDTIQNSVGLLGEVLGGLPPTDPAAVHDPFILELAEQCHTYRQQLQATIGGSITDEGQLVSALAVNDELQRVLDLHNDLVVKAAEGANLAAHTPTARHGDAEAPFAGRHFTISEEDEAADNGLATSRRPAAGSADVPRMPPPPIPGPKPPASQPGNLIDLGSADSDAIHIELPGDTPATVPKPPAPIPAPAPAPAPAPIPPYPAVASPAAAAAAAAPVDISFSMAAEQAAKAAAAEPPLGLAPPGAAKSAYGQLESDVSGDRDSLVAELDRLMLTSSKSEDREAH